MENWLVQLFMGDGIAHSIIILSLAISIGVFLGRFKIRGVSLGSTWILFVGIALSHFGMRINPSILSFIKDFGLILFVYSIGISVGPSFFSSFKKGGVVLNVWAAIVVLLGSLCAVAIHKITNTPLTTMIGVMQGAVTNTPGLGAAEQTIIDTVEPALSAEILPTLGLGYAMAYPMGVVGIILSIVFLRYILKVKMEKEKLALDEKTSNISMPERFTVVVEEDSPVVGKDMLKFHLVCPYESIVSRVLHPNGKVEIPSSKTTFLCGDKLMIVASQSDVCNIVKTIGSRIDMNIEEWNQLDDTLVSKNIVVTKASVDGKSVKDLNVRKNYGVSITRIIRSGVDIIAHPNTPLYIGDTLVVVGDSNGLQALSETVGNSLKHLYKPKISPIFLGIAIGVLLGSLPIKFPSMPQAIKLGLAGGPLIVAILLSYFGHKIKILTYTTQSANMMLSEIGISLFLASVGFGSGEHFVEAFVNGGYRFVFYGIIITMLPLLIVGILARVVSKVNYLTIMGLIAGSTTDPAALSFSSESSGNNYPTIGYATVYPLSMFLRVIAAQVLILIALG